MSYTINLTNGTTLIPGGLSDGTVDINHTSLTLIGRDYAGYGQFLNENFVYLLENFANFSSPANPLKGQLWWDTNNNILRVWSGISWKISTGATSSPFSNPPTDLSALGGDLWFDTTNSQLKVYTGTTWLVVGPTATPATGNTGAFPTIMVDTSSGSHIVIQFIISGTIYAIFSKDTFSTTLNGFTNGIVAGLNFNTAASPGWTLSTQTVNATPNTIVQRDNNNNINTFNLTAGGTVSATSLQGAVTTPGQTNITSVGTLTSLAVTGIITTGGSIVPSANTSVNIGSSTNWFNNIYGTSLHAQYADLAERFHADQKYSPGTVVELGGENEVTFVKEDLSENVFGVISTNAAYLMNSKAGEDATHPPIAMSGRVPVKVVGFIKKGDRLVSAGNGFARSGNKSELTPFNVIGRSLVDKLDGDIGIIEAIVKINS
jgi:hypothetical protein